MPHSSLAPRLAALPADLASALGELLPPAPFQGVIAPATAAALAERLGVTFQRLALLLVPLAQTYALRPTSNFAVGAVGLGLSGGLYLGANLEVAGQALCFAVHAEQAVTANAWINGETGLAALAVSASPCGHCRQFLNELTTAASLTVELAELAPTPLAALLPHAFGPADLGVTDALLHPCDHRLALDQSTDDHVILAALAAASACYSPYTRSYAGVALLCADGAVHTGRYAESAAYNPSLSPLAAALSQRALSAGGESAIIRAVLVQAPGPVSQEAVTRTVLSALTDAPLTVVGARTGPIQSP